MGSIWKAVTGFFKSKSNNDNNNGKDMEASTTTSIINQPEQDVNNEASDSDADDEDFVPNEVNEGAESEEISDGDDDDDDDSSPTRKKGKKRKAAVKPRSNVNGKRRRFQRNFNEDDEDVDFNFAESHENRSKTDYDEGQGQGQSTAEQLAAQEAQEKAETDRLYASFLSGVNELQEQRKKGQGQGERTVEKIVSKVVDFAGEKITVQDKVKVTVSSLNSNGNGEPSPVSTVALSDASSNQSTSTATTSEEPVAGPSSAMKASTNGGVGGQGQAVNKVNKPRRGGISILGNDPEAIGLDELDKRGLSGLLRAFQNKAAAANAKRIGTLEKSKLDWESYKRKQGLEEELAHHNKSRDTYIDKQEFLQRTDHRQFEIEKNMRATQRSKRLAN